MVKRPKAPRNRKKRSKSNKKLIIVILIIVLLFLAFVTYRIWLNVHFFITDDLVLLLEPQDKSLSVHYDEKPNVTFSINIENSFFCDAYCSYEFRDISSETSVDTGAFTSRGIGKQFKKTFQLSVDRVGSGQKIYSFDVQCNNIRTWYCLTNENKRKRSAFITLNYDISEYEKFLKDTLKSNITKLVNELSAIDVTIQQLNNRFFELGFMANLNEIENEKEILNNDYDAIVLEFENLKRVWSEQNYLLLSELFNKSYPSRISNVKRETSRINSEIDDILEKHNSIILELNKIDDSLRSADEFILFLDRTNRINEHRQLLNKIKELKIQAKQNTFTNYSSLDVEIKDAKESLENLEKDANKVFMNVSIKSAYYLRVEEEKLCEFKGICLDKVNFSSAIADSLHTNDSKIAGSCTSFESVKNTYEEENKKAVALSENYNMEGMQDIIDDAKAKKTAAIKKNISSEIKNINVGNESDEALSLLIDMSAVDSGPSGQIDYNSYSEHEILSLMQLNLSDDAVKHYNNYCKTIQTLNLSEYYGNATELNQVTEAKEINFTSRISIELTENYPVCCIFGECRRCCTEDECKEDPLLYPVLFLHGHSLNKDNSPDFSLDAFNKIQTKLQEEGYISAGTITPVSDYSEIKQNEWGLSSRPISVKGSYYLVSYYNLGSYSIATQKSENIETYAIRLKELIDLLKFRTGKDKVNIIAHSMGGLTARSYLQIFGDDDVDKLILVAVPNKGLSGKISSYCPLLGEKKECEDMSEQSIFIKRLNDPLKIPENTKIYNIVGVGCDMDAKDGDGIAVKENAELDYAENYYINGTCSRLKLLHTGILDIDKYPEVYDIIRSVLTSK
jgi:uncharacterized alpha/beta hydrolase family protein